jgi:REP element-mobilizing transposase RayT
VVSRKDRVDYINTDRRLRSLHATHRAFGASGRLFPVTSRGNRGTHIFLGDVDRLDFLDLLRSTVELFEWRMQAHCLMGTHYHLLVDTTRERLSEGMRRLNGVYALRFNRRYGLTGHLFETRFSSYVLRDEGHLAAAVRYILENPVRAGLCRDSRDWPWSAVDYRT